MNITPLNVTLAILGISLLVVVHEGGHYLAARAFGMRVLRFSIGLGPAIWKRQPKGSDTIFQICAIPLLAYVQIDGMNPAEEIDPDDDALYPNKGVFARSVTIFAGPFANYLAASVLVFGLCLVGGLPEGRPSNQVSQVMKHSAADGKDDCETQPCATLIRVGDRVVEVNGASVNSFEELVAANRGRADQPTQYIIERDGERMELTLTPEAGPTPESARLGIYLVTDRVYQTYPPGEALDKALSMPLLISAATLVGIASLIERRTTQGVQSVVGMTATLARSLEVSTQVYVFLLIQLSVALGLFNLLPFPALDGGRLAFLGYEVITRRRANEKIEAVVHTVGILFLLVVLALVMGRDIVNM